MDFKNGSTSFIYNVFIFWIALTCCDCAHVLIVPLYVGGSHMMAMVPIARSLVDRGHQVTFLISDVYINKYSTPEYTDYFKFEVYSCPNLDQDIAKINDQMVELAFNDNQLSQTATLVTWLSDIGPRVCDYILSDDELMKRFNNTIDAVADDSSWPCGIYIKSVLSKQRNAPIRGIVVSPTPSNPFIQQMAGSPYFPSIQPTQTSTFVHPMTFWQRVLNSFLYLIGKAVCNAIFSRPYHQIVDKYRLDPGMKSSIQGQVDLYLSNTEFAVEYPYSLTPNIIPVGGLTARPAKPLEHDLESFMQSSAGHGVIVFSLGSNFTLITKTRPEFVQGFIEALGRFPHKVLFHLRGDTPTNLPDNIKVMPWLPLQDVLGHPMTRLFIYHGGNNGFLEAVYHGVPLVIMPLVGDQIDNAVRVEAMGLGTTMDKNQLSPDYIYGKVNEVLQNPEYSRKVQRVSAIFKDRPMTAPDRAAFWIEHVIKHGGSYMRSSVHDLSFVQYYLLDVISFLIFTLISVLYLGYKLLKCCITCCIGAGKIQKAKME